MRRLQPVLPGARGRAAGGAGHHGVLPGGVAVQVRQPALHAMIGAKTSRDVQPRWPVAGGGIDTDADRPRRKPTSSSHRRRHIIIARGRAARPRLQLEQCHGCRGAPACMHACMHGWSCREVVGGGRAYWAAGLCFCACLLCAAGNSHGPTTTRRGRHGEVVVRRVLCWGWGESEIQCTDCRSCTCPDHLLIWFSVLLFRFCSVWSFDFNFLRS